MKTIIWIFGILMIGLSGCQSNVPSVSISSANKYNTNPLVENCQVITGVISARSENGAAWPAVVSEYLSQQLAAQQMNNAANLRKLVVNGQLDVIYGQFEYGTMASSLKIELQFDLTDPVAKKTIKSIQTTLFSKDKENITPQLHKGVDNLIKTLFPDSSPVAVQLTRGWTNFDRDGRKLAAAGDFRRAATAFMKAADARPDDHNALFNCGVMFEILQQHEQALSYYRRAVELSAQAEYMSAIQRVQQKLKP